jgi:hypothetical protein
VPAPESDGMPGHDHGDWKQSVTRRSNSSWLTAWGA